MSQMGSCIFLHPRPPRLGLYGSAAVEQASGLVAYGDHQLIAEIVWLIEIAVVASSFLIME